MLNLCYSVCRHDSKIIHIYTFVCTETCLSPSRRASPLSSLERKPLCIIWDPRWQCSSLAFPQREEAVGGGGLCASENRSACQAWHLWPKLCQNHPKLCCSQSSSISRRIVHKTVYIVNKKLLNLKGSHSLNTEKTPATAIGKQG